MKLSIAWIFDHIKGNWQDHDVTDLVAKINETTAEIEHAHHVTIDWNKFSVARVMQVGESECAVESLEWNTSFKLSARKNSEVGQWFLVKKDGSSYAWATCVDCNSDKEGLMPAVSCTEEASKGQWRNGLESEDYILELDNKSVTNRPDMWGHRGVAREVAAILGLELVPEEQFCIDHSVKHFADATDTQAAYSLDISKTDVCTRFAGIELDSVTFTPSFIWMAHRLVRIDTRGIDAFVDMTNYVLQDIGHPMHAFDADKVSGKTIHARQAREGEKLVMLDDIEIELTSDDCVIADDKQPLSLAGIMGGKSSGVSSSTSKLFLEAAHFNPTPVRLSAARHKVRTESSARFEKSLDPNNNTTALLRYMKLMNDAGIAYKASDSVMSVGPLAKEKTIEVAHGFITDCLGTTVQPDRVIEILQRLCFGVQEDGGVYRVTIPTYRGTKDIGIKEDIVEEIGRYIGYTNIVPKLPKRVITSQDHSAVLCRRACKQHCAFALKMREVYNYALYDEDFLRILGLNPENSVTLKNPVSEHWCRMVTSLVPHLLKNISENGANESVMQFFEWGRSWRMQDKTEINERSVCAGIWYDRTNPVDFYENKERLNSLFTMLDISVEWRKPETVEPWMDKHKTAELVSGDRVIGYAGMVARSTMEKVSQGSAFVFELDCDAIAATDHVEHAFKASSKYQAISLDISMLAPYSVTVAQLEASIRQADKRITDVHLTDIFEKDEWGDRRSVTIHCTAQDPEKTMTKEEIDGIHQAVHAAVTQHGVEVR